MWADKLALQSGKAQKRDADNKWRLKAADAVAMHCLHELQVRLLTCWQFLLICVARSEMPLSNMACDYVDVQVLRLGQCLTGLLSLLRALSSTYTGILYFVVTSTVAP